MSKLSSQQPGPVNQDQLEEWGAHCSLPTCNMLDFLPLKCPECEKLFCSNHFKPSLISSDSDHLCEKFILKSKNAELMNKSTTASNKVGSNNKKCSYVKCKTIMFSPISCRSCNLSYCPTHRLEQDHLCKLTSSGSTSTSKPTTHQANVLGYPNLMKNYLANKQTASKPSPSPTSQPQPHDHKIDLISNFSFKHPISNIKANQRNKSELESKQKALEFRIKNGLLTETDKRELQKLEEGRQNQEKPNPKNTNKSTTTTNKSNNPSDCCIV